MNGERVVFRYKSMPGRLSPTATLGLYLNERGGELMPMWIPGPHIPSFTAISHETSDSNLSETSEYW